MWLSSPDTAVEDIDLRRGFAIHVIALSQGGFGLQPRLEVNENYPGSLEN